MQFREQHPEGQLAAVNLMAPFGETISRAKWYNGFMFDRRLEGALQRGIDVSKVVVDGNMKLNGRVCGRPVAELLECPELGLFTACPCSKAPLQKKRRCREHLLTAPDKPLVDADTEVIVAHRRRRVLLKAWTSQPYDVLVKPRFCVEDGTSGEYRGSWMVASKATEEQLQEYWLQQEASGFVNFKTPSSALGGLACQTSKESSKEFKRLVRRGRFGGVLLACATNGYILHTTPFVGAETVTQRYFFVAALKCFGVFGLFKNCFGHSSIGMWMGKVTQTCKIYLAPVCLESRMLNVSKDIYIYI